MKITVIVLLIAMLLAGKAEARQPEYPRNLWMGLIGEASGDGERGMMAVCCVIRNRLAMGMDIGLVAMKRRDLGQFCKKEGHSREIMAKRVVQEVFEQRVPDITYGAIYFEGDQYPKPRWAYNKTVVARIGHHIFYADKGR